MIDIIKDELDRWFILILACEFVFGFGMGLFLYIDAIELFAFAVLDAMLFANIEVTRITGRNAFL